MSDISTQRYLDQISVPLEQIDAPTLRHYGVWRGWLVVFIGALCLYGLTAARTIQWQDSGTLVMRVLSGELVNPLGLALSHPLAYWLEKLAVIVLPLTPAHAVALVSALFGAMAVAGVYLIGLYLTGNRAASALAAAGLMVANTFWRFSTTPESYTLVAAVLLFEVTAIVQWDRSRRPGWLIAAFLINGIGFSIHNLALLTLPVVGLVGLLAAIKHQWRWKDLLLAIALWLIASAPFTGLVILTMIQTGEIGPTIQSALFGHSFGPAVAGIGNTLRYTTISLFFTAYSFPNLLLPAAAIGIFRARRWGISRLTRIVLLADLFIHLTFVLRYGIADQYTFLLPSFSLLAIFSAIGFAWIIRQWRGQAGKITIIVAAAALIALTPVLYAVGPKLLRSARVLGSGERFKPYRDDYAYLFIPWGIGQTSTQRTADQAVQLAGPDGIIIAEDSMGRFGVQYVVWRQQREGVAIVSRLEQALEVARQRGDQEPGHQSGDHHRTPDSASAADAAQQSGISVVLIPADTRQPPSPEYHWTKVGQLYVTHLSLGSSN